MMVWGYNLGRLSDNRTGKTKSYAAYEGNGLGSMELMQPTGVQGMTCLMRFKNSDLRSKSDTGTVYIHRAIATTISTCTRNATNTSSPYSRFTKN